MLAMVVTAVIFGLKTKHSERRSVFVVFFVFSHKEVIEICRNVLLSYTYAYGETNHN